LAVHSDFFLDSLEAMVDNMRKWKQEGGHELTHERYLQVIERAYHEMSGKKVSKGLAIMQKVLIAYKEAGERDWLFRTIQFELKDVDPLLLIISASRVYLDFSLTLTEFFKPKLLIDPNEPAQFYLTLNLISTLFHTSKGRGLL
jgi:hypothetical protein